MTAPRRRPGGRDAVEQTVARPAKLPDDVYRAAAVATCHYAADADEAALFLDMLGLHPRVTNMLVTVPPPPNYDGRQR